MGWLITHPFTQSTLVSFLITRLLNEPYHEVKCLEAEGFFPFSFKCRAIVIKDEVGDWLRIENLLLKVSYTGTIEQFTARKVFLLKKPIFRDFTEIPWEKLFDYILGQNKVELFQIPRFDIDPSLFGKKALLSLKLKGRSFWINEKWSKASIQGDGMLLPNHFLQIQMKGTDPKGQGLKTFCGQEAYPFAFYLKTQSPIKTPATLQAASFSWNHKKFGLGQGTIQKQKDGFFRYQIQQDKNQAQGLISIPSLSEKIHLRNSFGRFEERSFKGDVDFFFKPSLQIRWRGDFEAPELKTLKADKLLMLGQLSEQKSGWSFGFKIDHLKTEIDFIPPSFQGAGQWNPKTHTGDLKISSSLWTLDITGKSNFYQGLLKFSTPYTGFEIPISHLQGSFEGSKKTWSAFCQFAPKGDFKAQGTFNPENKDFSARLNGEIPEFIHNLFKIKGAKVEGTYAKEKGRLTLTSQKLSIGKDFKIANFQVDCDILPKEIRFLLSHPFIKKKPFFKMQGAFLPSSREIKLNEFQMGDHHQHLKLQGQGLFNLNDTSKSKALLRFSQGGHLSLQSAHFSFKKVPLSFASLFDRALQWIGFLSGDLKLGGTFPIGKIQLENFGYEQGVKNDFGLSGFVSLSQNGDRLIWNGKIDQLVTTGTWDPGRKTTEGTLKGRLVFRNLPLVHEDFFSGTLNCHLRFNGPLSKLQSFGNLSLQNGIYESGAYGVVFSKVNANILAQGSTWTIQKFQSYDSGKGSCTANGQITVRRNMSFNLNLKNFKVVEMPGLRFSANGTLSIQGPWDKPRIVGKTLISPGEVFLEELSPEDVPTIHLKQSMEKKAIKEALQKNKLPIPLNISLIAAQEFSIQGFGVNSLWQGSINVEGILSDPYLVGELNLKKGKMTLFGSPMKLIAGRIKYSAKHKNDPSLLLVALKEVGNVKAMLEIRGRSSSPQIRFSSIPALDESSILSYILFGKDVKSVSVTEGLQLANALASLQQGNINIVETIQSTFGIDVLELRETEGNDLEKRRFVRLGKDLGKFKVLVEQEVGTGTDSRASVSIPVSPSVNAEVGVDTESAVDVALNYVKRY